MKRQTSQKAWQEIMLSLGDDHRRALETVKEAGPGTAKELRRHAPGLYQDGFHKRLSELRNKGYIKETGVRKCRVTGRSAIVWEVVGYGCKGRKC